MAGTGDTIRPVRVVPRDPTRTPIRHPPVTVRVHNANQLHGLDLLFSNEFYSRGYKLQLVLRLSGERPTEKRPLVNPSVDISVQALPQDNADSELKWPFKGSIKVRFKESLPSGWGHNMQRLFLEGSEFRGDQISIEFSIQKPMNREPSMSSKWEHVDKDCIPGYWTYVDDYCYRRMPSVKSEIPSTLYILVKEVIHELEE